MPATTFYLHDVGAYPTGVTARWGQSEYWAEDTHWEKEMSLTVSYALHKSQQKERLRFQTYHGAERLYSSHLAAAIAANELIHGEKAPTNVGFFAGLTMSGELRPVRGALLAATAAAETGLKVLIVAKGNIEEASVEHRIPVLGFNTLDEVLQWLGEIGEGRGTRTVPEAVLPVQTMTDLPDSPELRQIVAAVQAGKSVLMIGPPGGGSTMVARRLCSVLPLLDEKEMREVLEIYSLAGLIQNPWDYKIVRPFRAPHHTVSDAGILGGGNPIRPGEVTLAHHGVLFLDEVVEFRRASFEAAIHAHKNEYVNVRGATLPSDFHLVAHALPCFCGSADKCRCSESSKANYQKRLDEISKQFDVIVPFRLSTPELRKVIHADP